MIATGRGRWTRPTSESTLRARFESRVRRTDDCWWWLGAPDVTGYGRIQSGHRSPSGYSSPDQAHRVAYRLYVGPIPGDLTIDHLCRNRMCVNPAHLELTTRAENGRRGATKTHCKNGHDLSVSSRTRANGQRECVPCRDARNRARFASC